MTITKKMYNSVVEALKDREAGKTVDMENFKEL